MSIVGQEIGSRSIRSLQVVVLVLCLLINVLDGFDLQATAFTSTRIMAEWRVVPAAMGLIFSAGLLGVGLGSFALSPIADRYGRRPTILFGLALITIGMLAVEAAASPGELTTLRLITGLGIGVLLPSLNTTASEYAPGGWRSLAISIYATGYPIGGAICGVMAPYLNMHLGWRSVYFVGGALSLLLLLAAAPLLPESLEFLLKLQPRGALRRAQRIAARLQLPALEQLPPQGPGMRAPSPLGVFQAGLAPRATLISATFFLLWLSEFFIVNWTPAILSREGLGAVASAEGGVMLTLGGMAGTLLIGVFAVRFALIGVCVSYLVGSFLLALVFAAAKGSTVLMPICALLGFLMYGSSVGLYAVVAHIFPARVRATGTGVALACGRGGAVLGLSLGGWLIGLGWTRPAYVGVLALPLLAAAATTFALRSTLAAEEAHY